MKKKFITVALLSIMITLVLFGSAGSALAEEINLALLTYQSDDFTQEEIDFAISNLQYKLDEQDLPRLIRVEEVYDFNEEPLYGLYEFDRYYMIVIRQTGSVMERGEGNSPYFGNNKSVKYYGGFGEYFIYTSDGFKNLTTNEYINQSDILQIQLRMQELRDLDYQDYLEAMSTPMLLGTNENRATIHKLGNELAPIYEFLYGDAEHLYKYFTEEINIDYQLKNNPKNIASASFGKIFTYEGLEAKNYGKVYYRRFDIDGDYDLLYPKNVYNECSLVTMTMLMQFYYRNGLGGNDLLDSIDYGYYDPIGSTYFNNPLYSFAEATKFKFNQYINRLQVGNSALDGAATYVNIDAAFDRYFSDNNIDCESVHFTSYTNIKGEIDKGHPSIFNTGLVGTGYSYDNGVSKSIDVSTHNLIAYGYTLNSIGVLDEFLCHAGWHMDDSISNSNPNGAECAKLFVSKFAAIGNVHLNFNI